MHVAVPSLEAVEIPWYLLIVLTLTPSRFFSLCSPRVAISRLLNRERQDLEARGSNYRAFYHGPCFLSEWRLLVMLELFLMTVGHALVLSKELLVLEQARLVGLM